MSKPVLDVEYFSELALSIDPYGDNNSCISNIKHFVARELRLAQHIKLSGKRGPECHAFVMRSGIYLDYPTTNICGIPHRDKFQEWPTIHGKALDYIGQINFCNSKNLFRCSLPGDIILLFALKENGIIRDIVHEWHDINSNYTYLKLEQCPRYFELPFYGTFISTYEFIESPQDMDSSYSYEFYYCDMVLNGTKIAGNPASIRETDRTISGTQDSSYHYLGQIGPIYYDEYDGISNSLKKPIKQYFGDMAGISIYYNSETKQTVTTIP